MESNMYDGQAIDNQSSVKQLAELPIDTNQYKLTDILTGRTEYIYQQNVFKYIDYFVSKWLTDPVNKQVIDSASINIYTINGYEQSFFKYDIISQYLHHKMFGINNSTFKLELLPNIKKMLLKYTLKERSKDTTIPGTFFIWQPYTKNIPEFLEYSEMINTLMVMADMYIYTVLVFKDNVSNKLTVENILSNVIKNNIEICRLINTYLERIESLEKIENFIKPNEILPGFVRIFWIAFKYSVYNEKALEQKSVVAESASEQIGRILHNLMITNMEISDVDAIEKNKDNIINDYNKQNNDIISYSANMKKYKDSLILNVNNTIKLRDTLNQFKLKLTQEEHKILDECNFQTGQQFFNDKISLVKPSIHFRLNIKYHIHVWKDNCYYEDVNVKVCYIYHYLINIDLYINRQIDQTKETKKNFILYVSMLIYYINEFQDDVYAMDFILSCMVYLIHVNEYRQIELILSDNEKNLSLIKQNIANVNNIHSNINNEKQKLSNQNKMYLNEAIKILNYIKYNSLEEVKHHSKYVLNNVYTWDNIINQIVATYTSNANKLSANSEDLELINEFNNIKI